MSGNIGRLSSLPRASGGVSNNNSSDTAPKWSSPRKRGCFCGLHYRAPHEQVFPAQAGVFPKCRSYNLFAISLPRASGGVSTTESQIGGWSRSSPRKRGCFRFTRQAFQPLPVFPAQAGVFPPASSKSRRHPSLPRASGGVSPLEPRRPAKWGSSPRKRGCFSNLSLAARPISVFPAQAGVFPLAALRYAERACLPRASGGVSKLAVQILMHLASSPRKRGCFCYRRPPERSPSVFPAQAGVFLHHYRKALGLASLPRASGGVSQGVKDFNAAQQSSPRKRGCFPCDCVVGAFVSVFPAQAGVFPLPAPERDDSCCLPRASGGVSYKTTFNAGYLVSSPRKRGCFLMKRIDLADQIVFPAQAGVFPTARRSPTRLLRLPRASGGVSRDRASNFGASTSSPRKRGCFSPTTP